MKGAMAGTSVKIIMAKLTTRAISRPRYMSRTSAKDTTRGPAAPSPCSRRAAKTPSSVGET